MLAIRHSNLSHRTCSGYTRASRTDEQRKSQNEVEWNRNQEHRNLAFNPHQAAFNYNVELDYSSQKIVAIGPMIVACQYCKAFKFKNEADRLCCASGPMSYNNLTFTAVT